MKSLFKKNTKWLIFTVSIFIYSFTLTALCEFAAHHKLIQIATFLFRGNLLLAVTNTSLLLAFFMLFVIFLTKKISIGVGVVSILSYIPYIVDGMKILFRNEPLYLSDLAVAGEAANVVMGNMTLKFSGSMIVTLLFILLSIAFAIFADIKLFKIRIKYRYGVIVSASAVLFLVLTWSTLFSSKYLEKHSLHTKEWNQLDSYKKNGFVYSLLSNALQSKVSKPEEYSEQTIDDIVQSVVTDGKEDVAPNIIIFMSEAYTDIESAEKLTFSKDINANFERITAEHYSGRALTKQMGGGTANSEFEVLTGLSSALVPPGVIAYTNYIKPDAPSIVSFLKDNGYYTTATHPHLRSFFSRETAYEHLGFDKFYSVENFEGAKTCRIANYVSDEALVDKIISLYEQNKSSGKPFFNHSVSMQNHTEFYPNEFSGDDAVTITTDANITDEEKGILETYAGCMYLTDKAIGKLVDYFENVDEPTVILYFGDHQPFLATYTYELYKRIGYLPEDETNAQFKYYSTPYFIWNNFKETEENKIQDMSMFQLLPFMTEKLNMIRPDHYYFLNDMAKDCKGFNGSINLDSEGNPVKEQSDEAKIKYEQFKLIQYDLLHGKKYSQEEFY